MFISISTGPGGRVSRQVWPFPIMANTTRTPQATGQVLGAPSTLLLSTSCGRVGFCCHESLETSVSPLEFQKIPDIGRILKKCGSNSGNNCIPILEKTFGVLFASHSNYTFISQLQTFFAKFPEREEKG